MLTLQAAPFHSGKNDTFREGAERHDSMASSDGLTGISKQGWEELQLSTYVMSGLSVGVTPRRMIQTCFCLILLEVMNNVAN